jgi:hypothetical protein
MARRTKITIESNSLLILLGGSSKRVWCPQCAAEAEMVALGNAGAISNSEQLDLEKWPNSEQVHRSQATDGSVQICLTSLVGCLKPSEARSASRWIENRLRKIRRKL